MCVCNNHKSKRSEPVLINECLFEYASLSDAVLHLSFKSPWGRTAAHTCRHKGIHLKSFMCTGVFFLILQMCAAVVWHTREVHAKYGTMIPRGNLSDCLLCESWKLYWYSIVLQYLLGVPLCVRQLCGHMEHDLFVAVVAVDRFCASLPVSHV